MNDVPQEDRTLAMVAHLSGILTWFVGPLIFWLIHKDKADKSFITDQSREALNFQITLCIGWVAAVILSVIGIGLLLFPVIWILNLVFSILAGVKANEGVAYRYPFALRLIK